MRNFIIFLSFCFFVLFTKFIGTKRFPIPDEKGNGEKKITSPAPAIPNIGRIEVLNGCGIPGAAGKVADFLREKQFDVKLELPSYHCSLKNERPLNRRAGLCCP